MLVFKHAKIKINSNKTSDACVSIRLIIELKHPQIQTPNDFFKNRRALQLIRPFFIESFTIHPEKNLYANIPIFHVHAYTLRNNVYTRPNIRSHFFSQYSIFRSLFRDASIRETLEAHLKDRKGRYIER